MRSFSQLYTALDETTKTNEKVAAMVRYFAHASSSDAAWALYFLSGRKPKQAVPGPKLQQWVAEAAGIPPWLFDESYSVVGDLAETIALLIVPSTAAQSIATTTAVDRSLTDWVEQVILPMRKQSEDEQHAQLLAAWFGLPSTSERFVFNKLITSAFRVGVSQRLVVKALSESSGIAEPVIAHRLMGEWQPTPAFFAALMSPDTLDADISKPYPFFLAYPVEDRIGRNENLPSAEVAPDSVADALGPVEDWQIEWKWDGIRAQVIRRKGQTFVWSRGEENITERFPEIVALGDALPDGTVIDGEILPFMDEQVLPFAKLQQRIGRKTLSKKILAEVPVILVAYDLLEWQGEDVRPRPLTWRREQLQALTQSLGQAPVRLSEMVHGATWREIANQRERSRELNAEGLMIKLKESAYGVGRTVGAWWKWKINPFLIDCVLIYAQRGHGRRANLYSDYTFAVWDGEGEERQLVPFAKAYSGLTDAEMAQVDAFVRRNIVEAFGPVRSVKPELVFELAFEGIQRSSRHKSGIATRFPRINRWRHDKPAAEADSLERIKALLPSEK